MSHYDDCEMSERELHMATRYLATIRERDNTISNLRAELAEAKQRARDASAVLIEEIGGPGAEWVDETARRAAAELARLRAELERVTGELESHEQERGVLLGVCEAALGPRDNMTLVEDVQELVRRCRQWEALRDDVIACARFANYYSKAENGYALNARRVLAALSESIAHVAAPAAEPTTGEVADWREGKSERAVIAEFYTHRVDCPARSGKECACDRYGIKPPREQPEPAAKDEPGLLPVGTPVRVDAVPDLWLPEIASGHVCSIAPHLRLTPYSVRDDVTGTLYTCPAHAVHAIKAGAK